MTEGLVLVTGGIGKTGRRINAALSELQIPHRAAARQVSGPDTVVFDWTKPGTWDRALEGVHGIYLVAPTGVGDPAPLMTKFVEAATARGTRRFVLLSASLLKVGDPAMGQVHQWLEHSDAEWAVLRPSWFMENFTEGPHAETIRSERKIYSATRTGRVPFISADDIAAAAVAALTMADAPNTDFVLTGSETLSYDDVATTVGTLLGSPVEHRALSYEELVSLHVANGLAESHAQTLAFMDLAIADGVEDRTTQDISALTGRPAIRFADFASANLAAWR